jgi:hypothetical protein
LPAARVSPRRGKITFLADAGAARRMHAKPPPGPGTGGEPERKGGAG